MFPDLHSYKIPHEVDIVMKSPVEWSFLMSNMLSKSSKTAKTSLKDSYWTVKIHFEMEVHRFKKYIFKQLIY